MKHLKTEEEKKQEKRIYDIEYRRIHREKRLTASKKWYAENTERAKKYSIQYQKDHPEETYRRKYLHNLKTYYGIGSKEYNEMFQSQNGECAICGIHQSDLNKPLSVDHDHETGIIRGLLCNRCNLRLRGINSDISILINAIEYLCKDRPNAIKIHQNRQK